MPGAAFSPIRMRMRASAYSPGFSFPAVANPSLSKTPAPSPSIGFHWPVAGLNHSTVTASWAVSCSFGSAVPSQMETSVSITVVFETLDTRYVNSCQPEPATIFPGRPRSEVLPRSSPGMPEQKVGREYEGEGVAPGGTAGVAPGFVDVPGFVEASGLAGVPGPVEPSAPPVVPSPVGRPGFGVGEAWPPPCGRGGGGAARRGGDPVRVGGRRGEQGHGPDGGDDGGGGQEALELHGVLLVRARTAEREGSTRHGRPRSSR